MLVTGAAGYIGGRLVPELLARGYRVRVMVRGEPRPFLERWPGVEVAVADALDLEGLSRALEGVAVAYYLIHSLMQGPHEFASTELQAAVNFREAAAANGLDRIIYLGGLGDTSAELSPHLRSRLEVAGELKRGPVPVTILRAAIVIGSGSAPYEIMYHLVRRLPVLLIPHWGHHRCQPIAIRDVRKYLVGVLEVPATSGRDFDIGGPDVLTYREMLRILARVLGERQIFLRSPFYHLTLSSYIAGLLTPVPAPLIKCLMGSLKNDVVCRDEEIREFLPFPPLGYREAIERAHDRENQDSIVTRWSDSYPPGHELALRLHELDPAPQYLAEYALDTTKDADRLFAALCRVGGKEGWFHSNWMWRLRGWVDRLLLGVGTLRGRRSSSTLRIGDALDFWRVEDLQPGRRILLRAEMKMPGLAWLEFLLQDKGEKRELAVKAYFSTQTLGGRLYWYCFLPFHHFIFVRLLQQIVKKA